MTQRNENKNLAKVNIFPTSFLKMLEEFQQHPSMEL